MKFNLMNRFERLKLKTGEEYDISDLSEKLFSYGYEYAEEVLHIGEFCIKGLILDIYPHTFRSPLRIIFDFEEISEIFSYSIDSGEKITEYKDITIIPFKNKPNKRLFPAARRDYMENFYKIRKGDYVVHINYGIGKYLGTKKLKKGANEKKYMAILYAENEILYVEAGGHKLIERYIGHEGHKPKLNKLRSKEWEKTKSRVKKAVKSIAVEMLEIQAKRNALEGFAFEKDTVWQKEFEAEFPFEETPDQKKAIFEVKKNMESKRPMDRLICGDVGYGKTEIALRAAFKAVMSGKQAAFLVPTTILAEQHFLTLTERVKNFPISVELLSRFKTKKEQKEVVEKLKSGTCDIVIGTHRLLSKDVKFKDLGLVIIDEEQRFGVRDKEKLKKLRYLVDVLTLTATPIPRTLYMSLVGLRDISIISTPPKQRLPIETVVTPYNENIIKDAVQKELERGGQVYFVHNRVRTIDKVKEHLEGILPGVRFGQVHGQMPSHILEERMLKFMRGEIDCLVTTTIIESGLDIPNVNTLIVDRADRFGLSSLYQLRGRIGRFKQKRKAYAYFMIPARYALSSDAQRRLEAIAAYTELGSGFKIAMEDLEIRGAGNLLGSEQSGFISQVGFDLYCRLLHEAVKEING